MRTVTLERCTKQDADFSKQNQMFEYATDYTIREFTSNMCHPSTNHFSSSARHSTEARNGQLAPQAIS
jgi:hypothetical protein